MPVRINGIQPGNPRRPSLVSRRSRCGSKLKISQIGPTSKSVIDTLSFGFISVAFHSGQTGKGVSGDAVLRFGFTNNSLIDLGHLWATVFSSDANC